MLFFGQNGLLLCIARFLLNTLLEPAKERSRHDNFSAAFLLAGVIVRNFLGAGCENNVFNELLVIALRLKSVYVCAFQHLRRLFGGGHLVAITGKLERQPLLNVLRYTILRLDFLERLGL